MADAEGRTAARAQLVPTKNELKLIAHVRNWGPREISRSLRFAEERAVYHTPSLTAHQLSGLFLLHQLARRIRKCRRRERCAELV